MQWQWWPLCGGLHGLHPYLTTPVCLSLSLLPFFFALASLYFVGPLRTGGDQDIGDQGMFARGELKDIGDRGMLVRW